MQKKTNPFSHIYPGRIKDQRSGKVIPIILLSKTAPKPFLYIHDILQMPHPERLLSRFCQTQGQLNCLLYLTAAEIALYELTVLFIAERLYFAKIQRRNSADGSLEDNTFTFSVWFIVLLEKVDARLKCLVKYLYPSLV